jgi:hypothetical protein
LTYGNPATLCKAGARPSAKVENSLLGYPHPADFAMKFSRTDRDLQK